MYASHNGKTNVRLLCCSSCPFVCLLVGANKQMLLSRVRVTVPMLSSGEQACK